MAVYEHIGIQRWVDANGDTHILYPATKTAALEDGDEIIKSTEQDFTDSEKAQARKNIGAGTVTDEELKAVEDKIPTDTVTSSQLSNVEQKIPTDTVTSTQLEEVENKIPTDTVTSFQLQEVANNHNETIIGLSVDGTTVTYIKGDGSVHSFETQDTNTTYSLGTDEATGLTKLYATIGSAEDGTMTQKAIKTELDKKVGVSIDESQDMLIFSI